MTKVFKLNHVLGFFSAAMLICCASPVRAKPTHSFTGGLAVGDKVLLGKKLTQLSAENANALVLWDVGASKIVQNFSLPDPSQDVIELFPSSNTNEVFVLTQTRLAGMGAPELLKLDLKSGAVTSVVESIDCSDLRSVSAAKGRLDFSCGSDTPNPPKKAKFSLPVKTLQPNSVLKLQKGLKVGSFSLDDLKADELGVISELTWKSDKAAVKSLKATDVQPQSK